MKEEQDLIEFDDSDAIEFIKELLPDEAKNTLSDDDIQYVLDLIIEYYEENNLIAEGDEVQESEIAEDDMFEYISVKMKEEKIVDLLPETLQLILDGEYAYGISIGIYE
ncbi:MAG: hypothetical protein LBS50_10785 [Prevotellaceae bacterium]|jgi:replicative DNA helicase|nr:hypothetical protein [Prevotellaceae bacterium]